MSEHLTRRELKTDQFAVTIEHATHYFGVHRKQVLQIGAGVVLAVLLAVGAYFWVDHARTARELKLAEALRVADAGIGPASTSGGLTFPTQPAKDAMVVKAYSELAAQYSGSNEGAVAEYSLGGLAAAAGRNDEARKRYQAAIDSGGKEYASLAKFALAQLDFSDNKAADGEKLLRELMDRPTALVSKEQSTLTLARLISKTHPAEARKLVAPLLKETGEVGTIAQRTQGDIAGK